MIITDTIIRPNGDVEAVEVAVADNYFDPPGVSTAEQITALKAQLESTDYKIIKCSEYSLAGMPAPYDIAALHTERQTIRDQINALEASP